ncbi:MAG TPA: hypothetical protein VK988_03165 [Acidimicrobiales bacterium]|nr:hypothetical protein [Acidimicrobiales bacterium]
MGQPVVRFHHIVADGFGKDTYGWDDILFLRVDYPGDCLDLVVESDGEWSIEATFAISGIHDDLVEARVGDADLHELLELLLDAATSRVRTFPLSAEDIARFDALPLIAGSTVGEEVEMRGLWQPHRRAEE